MCLAPKLDNVPAWNFFHIDLMENFAHSTRLVHGKFCLLRNEIGARSQKVLFFNLKIVQKKMFSNPPLSNNGM